MRTTRTGLVPSSFRPVPSADPVKIALGTDHAGFVLKEAVKALLVAAGHTVEDFGTSSEESVDYPDYIVPAARAVQSGDCDRAVVFGGSGNGEAMAANRLRGVRVRRCAGTSRPPRSPAATTTRTA